MNDDFDLIDFSKSTEVETAQDEQLLPDEKPLGEGSLAARQEREASDEFGDLGPRQKPAPLGVTSLIFKHEFSLDRGVNALRTEFAFVQPGDFEDPFCQLSDGIWKVAKARVDSSARGDPRLAASKEAINETSVSGFQGEYIPSDTEYANQSHLGERFEDVWDDYTGAGVRVVVFDSGFDRIHEDLWANYATLLDYDYANDDIEPEPQGTNPGHGTFVAGIIAALEGNGVGGVGVAYDSTIVGYSDFGFNSSYFPEMILDAAGLGDYVGNPNGASTDGDIINLSGGRGSNVFLELDHDDLSIASMEQISAYGRNGLGTIFVKSAGNNRAAPNSSSREETTAERFDSAAYTITVAAIREDGYVDPTSSPGATLLASATVYDDDNNGAVLTTSTGGGYGSGGGTSAAAPQISGVVALMLEANPNLGWRDVQKILAYSSMHTGSAVGALANSGTSDTDGMNEQATQANGATWFWNDADNWNGGGLHFSNDYGYGLVDPKAAVRLAETWEIQSTTANWINTIEDDFDTPVSIDFSSHNAFTNETTNILIEHVSARISFESQYLADINFYLTSPSGTRVQLIADTGDSGDWSGFWSFGTPAFMGETSAGQWVLEAVDDGTGWPLTLNDFVLITYGSAIPSGDTWIFTNEYSEYDGVAGHRTNFSSTGGVDVINAAAVDDVSATINLSTNTGTIDGVGVIFSNFIERVYTGDGADLIIGDANTQFLSSGRGSDIVIGGSASEEIRGGQGNDILEGAGGNDFLFGEEGNDTFRYNSGITFAASEQINGGEGQDRILLATAGSYDFNIPGLDIRSLEEIEFGEGSGFRSAAFTSKELDQTVEVPGNFTIDGNTSGTDNLFIYIDSAIALDDFDASNWVIQDWDQAVDILGIIGDNVINTIYGSSTGDYIEGGGGNDFLFGGFGNDVIDDGTGVDTVFAGSGDDLVIAGDTSFGGGDYWHGGAGIDTFSFLVSGNWGSNIVTTDLRLEWTSYNGFFEDVIDFENYIGSDGGWDSIIGTNGANSIETRGGRDSIFGWDGDDIVYAGNDDDYLNGADGNDYLYGGDGHDSLFGGNGNDQLDGGLGNDSFYGGDGNDTMNGLNGDDWFWQTADGDVNTIYGGFGYDTVDLSGSGTGWDVGFTGSTTYETTNGSTTIVGFLLVEAIVGTNHDDRIREVSSLSLIYGGAGDDTIRGIANGSDSFYGGSGNDTFDIAIFAGSYTFDMDAEDFDGALVADFENAVMGGGNDTVIAEDGVRNTILAGGGDDIIRKTDSTGGSISDSYDGGSGADTLEWLGGISISHNVDLSSGHILFNGNLRDALANIENVTVDGAGTLTGDGGDNELISIGTTQRNTMYGGAGNDVIDGGGGNDTLQGDSGDDTIFGGSGNDTLGGGAGDDAMYGGGGDDVFRQSNDGGSDYARGLSGADTLDLTGSTAGWVRELGTLVSGSTSIRHSQIETLIGSFYDDVIWSETDLDYVDGAAGDDTIVLSTVFLDEADGGSGVDTLVINSGGGHFNLGAGTYFAYGQTRAIANFENIVAGSGSSEIAGTSGNNSIDAQSGNDTVVAGAGNDTIIGGEGADTLDGSAGIDTASYSNSGDAVTVFLNGQQGIGGEAAGDVLFNIEVLVGSAFGDILFGNAGANSLFGGDGIDVLQGGAGPDVLDGGGSLDWAGYFDATGPLTIDLATPANSSAFFAEDTLISIEIIGGATNFSNTFQGDTAPNIFIGGSATDTIAGGGGGDLLQGGGGNDTIIGEAGTDAVMGNKGDDALYGGAQADGFYFQDGDGDDVIWDFDITVDKFVFISANFNDITDLSFSEFGGNAVITYGSATITVDGVTQAQIDSDASLYQWF